MKTICLLGICLGTLGTLAIGSGAKAEDRPGLEVELQWSGFTGGLMVGKRAGERAVVLVGLTGGWAEGSLQGEPARSLALEIPVELKLYLDRPQAGDVVPTTRFGIAYGKHSQQADLFDLESHRVGGGAQLGIAYFPTEALAISLEAGPRITRQWSDGAPLVLDDAWAVDLDWHVGLVLRR